MILDGFALQSLHLLPPNDALSRTKADAALLDNDRQKFSLLNTIDLCLTAFGRRRLRQCIVRRIVQEIEKKKEVWLKSCDSIVNGWFFSLDSHCLCLDFMVEFRDLFSDPFADKWIPES